MAYVEIWKSGILVTRRLIDEEKAQKGCNIRLGSIGEVRLTIGQAEKAGDYEIRMLSGDPPQENDEQKQEVSKSQEEIKSQLPLNFSADTAESPEQTKLKTPEVTGYRFIKRLGRGGMGVVWLAEQLSTKRKVALKLMVSHALDSEKGRARFQREVELTARLNHSNIARIYDSGLHQGIYYYAMELIDGLPLDKYVKYHNLSRKQILKLMNQVCIAVLYAHLRAVIHRDLKPSNIIIDEDGQPHILDFGLAKALLDDEAPEISMSGQITGTPAYMSPEQASGHHSDLDTRTDVFSLGVILYELITGQAPHDSSGSMIDLLKQITAGNIRRPSEIDKTIDNELEAILLKALAKDPEERYASAGALARDIFNYLDEEPLDARVPTTLYFLRKKALKHKKEVAISAVALVIIFVTVISAYTRFIGQRAVLRATQEEKAALETELTELRQRILSGNQEEVEAALAILEQKYQDSQRQVLELQQLLSDMRESTVPVPSETGSYIIDANLKQAVKEALGITTEPSKAQIASLTKLDVEDRGITDLTGLEYALNLIILNLNINNISNFSPLSGLSSLQRLELGNNNIGNNISSLADLPPLEGLNLYGNGISDISNILLLSGLSNLEDLELQNNQISDIYVLSQFTNLRMLRLWSNQIRDISPLVGLTNLEELCLWSNQISDISPLTDLINLKYLQLGGNQVSNISPISGLTNLQELQLWGNQISDISSVSGLSKLTFLDLRYNQISNIAFIAGLTNLQELHLEQNQISDISPISELTNLTQLNLRMNPLNQEAYDVYIPMIQTNNPGIELLYDR